MVRSLFNHGHMLKEHNVTCITLIPKIDSSESVNHCRPISVCNISYKIISKVLTKRIKKVLHNIISPFQAVFIQGGDIDEYSCCTRNVEFLKKKKKRKIGIYGNQIRNRKKLMKD